jgi:glutathione S-transferase
MVRVEVGALIKRKQQRGLHAVAFPSAYSIMRERRYTMAIQLFELCGAGSGAAFQPYCWRSRLALAHKGLAVETIPWRFTEKAAIGAHEAQKVPVMLDNGRAIIDSWVIAEYLEDTYPERPSLFGGAGGQALARFINAWGDAVLHAGIARLVVSDIPQHLAPEDVAYSSRIVKSALA